jgi:hypothetical protein
MISHGELTFQKTTIIANTKEGFVEALETTGRNVTRFITKLALRGCTGVAGPEDTTSNDQTGYQMEHYWYWTAADS